ncbi:branched-chain amino acid ABC transporter substrate-binding protein [Dankookia rubra]|uniref:Branched-chain amino acid ABC transporter substrate-binding protein n=1 Tax=Dankookia rubra TaxID=1442381 RepID=A0A4V6PKA3_9PROT|nr:ABC transporter substrate-binding protein [Dankookia rubra]TDH59485.1 branched-chain amino acid ABC transporter substrate-binding protein [Dankookia rubra]
MRRTIRAVAGMLALLASFTGLRAQTVRGVTDTEIVIGTYTDLSGVTVAWGVNNSNAIRMAFDEVNARGGIHGRRIRYIVEDNQYQVPRSIQASNKLINRDNVFLMIANGGTPMNNAVMPDQLAKNVPNMFPLTSARSMYWPYHRLKFGLASSYYDQMRAAVKLLVEQRGKKTLCAMYQDTDFGRDVMEGVRDQMKAMNVALAAETAHKPTDADFSAAVAKLRDAKCDVILLGTIVRDTNQIVAAVRKIGWDVPLMAQVAAYDSAVAEVPGGVTEGLECMTSVLFVGKDDPRPAVQAFQKGYREKYGRDPNFAAQIGYSAAQVLIEGLTKAGRNLSLDSFVAGMESIRDFNDIFGSPPMTYGPNVRQGSNQSYVAVVRAGKWQLSVEKPVGY